LLITIFLLGLTAVLIGFLGGKKFEPHDHVTIPRMKPVNTNVVHFGEPVSSLPSSTKNIIPLIAAYKYSPWVDEYLY
jgi:hypothetical protein